MQTTNRSWWRTGCLAISVFVGIVVLVAGVGALVISRQIRAESPELNVAETTVPVDATKAGFQAPTSSGRIELDIRVVQLTVVPVAADRPLRASAFYDPARYTFLETREDSEDGTWTYRLSLLPQSLVTAIVRAKLGGNPASLRLEIPRGVSFDLETEVHSGFAAMELGGLQLRDATFKVDAGGVNVGFAEPTAQPMRRFVAIGNGGSIEVSSLGNASPEEAILQQHLGELDLDLRGDWIRPTAIRVRAGLAGGSIWLPEGARVTGIDRPRPFRIPPEPTEVPTIPIDIDIVERGATRMLLVE